MKILAIDGSTKSTGIAIFEDKNLIKYDCITASSSNLYKRIEKMQEEIRKILTENQIDKIYIEEVIPEDVLGNTKVFKALMYLQGALCKVFDEFGLTPEFIFTNEWRSKCGIPTGRNKRESLKPKDIAFVKNHFNIDVNDDIADAICIGYASTLDGYKVGGFEFK